MIKTIYDEVIKTLEIEFEKTLQRYYILGGTADFLERSGIKKTKLSDLEL